MGMVFEVAEEYEEEGRGSASASEVHFYVRNIVSGKKSALQDGKN